MPSKRSAAAVPAKTETASKAKVEAKSKSTKEAVSTTKQTAAPTPSLTSGLHTTTVRSKRNVDAPVEETKTTGVKRRSPAPASVPPAAKKPKITPSPKSVVKKQAGAKRSTKGKQVINHPPTDLLNVYVFGEGHSGELGLGSDARALEVKRPRLNPLLPADETCVIQVAVGGMHTLVLTKNNKILTWGVNDQGALGRDTAWEGGLRDMDADGSDSESDSDAGAVNPHESTPAEVNMTEVPKGTIWTQVVAGDSTSFALTSEGQVYGWGTFRGNEGIIGFNAKTRIQTRPTLLPNLQNVISVACGTNHVLALDSKGAVFAWGSGQQNQLGRRIIERTKLSGLTPTQFGLKGKKITLIGCGSYHSFAVTETGDVYGWGLNSFGETGISKSIDEGGDESDVHHPALITTLSEGQHGKVTHIEGGAHHSVAVTNTGVCLVWGRMDGGQSGIPVSSLKASSLIYDSASKPRILKSPTPVPNIHNAVHCSAGSDHCLAATGDGHVYTWGFNATYQCGQGVSDDINTATQIDNTAVRGKKIVWVGGGGQFSVIAGLAGVEANEGDSTMVNGVH